VRPYTILQGSPPAANPLGTGLVGSGAFGNSQYNYSQLHTQGFTNQFLSNTNDSSNQLANEISFQFSGLTITGASSISRHSRVMEGPDSNLKLETTTMGRIRWSLAKAG
jgi:hypothetical protein